MNTPLYSSKLRVDDVTPEHVRLTLFMGKGDGTKANCGSLCMSHIEYQLFATALSLGSDQMGIHLNHDNDERKLIEWHKQHPEAIDHQKETP